MSVVGILPDRGIKRVLWDQKTWLLAWQFATTVQPLLDKSVRDRMLKHYRDKHPGIMRKMPKDAGIPGIAGGAYLFPETIMIELEDFLREPANIAAAKDDLLAVTGYGAGKRDALDAVATEIVMKVTIQGVKLEMTRSDLPSLKSIVEKLDSDHQELLDKHLDMTVERNVLRDEVAQLRKALASEQNKFAAFKDATAKRFRDLKVVQPEPPRVKPRISIRAAVGAVIEWRQMPGCPANYQVSNTGQFRNTDTGNALKLQTFNGVLQVHGYKRDRTRSKLFNAAKTVAAAFMPAPRPDMVLHFNDGDRSNIRLDNMAWLERGDPRVTKADYLPISNPAPGLTRRSKYDEMRIAA